MNVNGSFILIEVLPLVLWICSVCVLVADVVLFGIFDLLSNLRVITSLCRYGQLKCKISFGISVHKIK